MVSAGMEKGRSQATVAGGKLMELRLSVSAGMEKGRSHATVAGGKLMELRLRGWRREGAMPRLLEVSK